jgi:predicted phosphoribosyltransferase
MALEVQGLTVILVDDGVATGSTMLAALTALRQRGAARLVAATPVMAKETSQVMSRHVDELVAVLLPHDLQGVGRWYLDFNQTTDEQVRELLVAAADPGEPTGGSGSPLSDET